MRPSIIFKHIFGELFITFLTTVAFLNLVLTMNKLMTLSKKFLDIGISFTDFLTFSAILQPQLFILTIPTAFLLSILITYGRLDMDNELTILKAAGMPFNACIRPVYALGVISYGVALFVCLYLAPASLAEIKSRINTTISKRLPGSIKEKIFNMTFDGMVIIPDGKSDDNSFSEIFIFDERDESPVVTWAERAAIFSGEKTGGINVKLQKGAVYVLDSRSITEISFEKYLLSLDAGLKNRERKAHEFPIQELWDKMNSQSPWIDGFIEFHRRLSLPFVSLCFALFGPALIPLVSRAGRLAGLSTALAVCGGYYLLMIFLNNLVQAGVLHHLIGGWGAIFLLASLSIFSFLRVYRK